MNGSVSLVEIQQLFEIWQVIMPRETKSYIHSIGVYLPPKTVTTKEVIAGCRESLRLPLEKLTGIRSRHTAGDDEFSIDLAIRAIEDCLSHSDTAPEEFDFLVCANISRYDGPERVSYEPSTAAKLKHKFGFKNAIAFDISNACAGLWTSVYLTDCLLRTGAIGRGLVVSGEYITYLADTAQKEIVDYLDPQVASLTLGDAGVAVELRLSTSKSVGFHDIELYTLAQYSRDCIAKPSNQPHGGAAMYTEAVKVSSAVVPHAAKHVEQILKRNSHTLSQYQHLIPHQTSRLTMQDAIKTVATRFPVDLGERLINNLADRGNTATTSHFLALRDKILEKRIRSGDDVLFLISGSGQTTGTALYTFDDLPDRLHSSTPERRSTNAARIQGETLAVPIQIESLALVKRSPDYDDTLAMLGHVTQKCLDQSRYEKQEIDLLLSVGIYRSEFLTEPAIAALLAGDLHINDDREPHDEDLTLAFDILNGGLGFLNAVFLVSEVARVGGLEQALIVASEIENNTDSQLGELVGVHEMASALMLHESADGEAGFLAFAFDQYSDSVDSITIDAIWNDNGRFVLEKSCRENDFETCLENIATSVSHFLEEHAFEVADFRFLIPPQVSPEFVAAVRNRLEFSEQKTIDVSESDGDLLSSATPASIAKILNEQLAKPGDLALIVNIACGGQVGCAIYRF